MGARTERAQMPIDFLTGMVLFLTVVGFFFLFTPGLMSPSEDVQEETLVADRVAEQLVTYHLGTPSTATLDTDCAIWFFTDGTDGSCAGDSLDGATLNERVGVHSRYAVNVSLRANVTGDAEREILCTDGASVTDCSSGGTSIAVGPTHVSGEGSLATAQRHVTVDGRDALVVVQLW